MGITSKCAWEGCRETFEGYLPQLPDGWKVLVVADGSLLESENLLNADIDCVLCPKHNVELRKLLWHGHHFAPAS